jgi:hypothetical protein
VVRSNGGIGAGDEGIVGDFDLPEDQLELEEDYLEELETESELPEVLLYISSDCDSQHYARLAFLTNENSNSP